MGGAFRDDQVAARERADALEQRVRELEGEKNALEARLDGPSATRLTGRASGPSIVTIALGLGALGLFGGLVLARALPIALLVAVALVTMTLVWGIGLRQFVTAGPGELWVVTGGRSVVQADGIARGYHLLWPGDRRLLIPLVEVATSMSLQPFRVQVRLNEAHARDGATVEANAVAVITLDRAQPHHAIERFLGRPEAEIAEVSRDVLTSALRRALTRHPHGDTDALQAELLTTLREDLAKLGLVVDTLLSVDAHPVPRP